MKKFLCLTLALLFLLPTLAGCNDVSFSSLPESSPSFSPSIGQDSVESDPSSTSFVPVPSESDTGEPSFSELPLPIDEIYFYVQRYGADVAFRAFDRAGYFENTGKCPQEVADGSVTVAFCITLNTDILENYKGYSPENAITRLEALEAKTLSELTDPEKTKYGHLYDENGNPIPEEFEAEKQSPYYALEYADRYFEIGKDAIIEEAKTIWLERCKKAGVPAVDVGKGYLYVICTLPELCAMADRRERGLMFYRILSASKEQYIADRENMVK